MRAATHLAIEPAGDAETDDAAARRTVQRLFHGMGSGIAAAAADRRASAGAGDPRLEREAYNDQYERLKQNLSQSVAAPDPAPRFYRQSGAKQTMRTLQVPRADGLFTIQSGEKLGRRRENGAASDEVSDFRCRWGSGAWSQAAGERFGSMDMLAGAGRLLYIARGGLKSKSQAQLLLAPSHIQMRP
jgi:hypothetical protein